MQAIKLTKKIKAVTYHHLPKETYFFISLWINHVVSLKLRKKKHVPAEIFVHISKKKIKIKKM